jgi:hypothetical protein
MLPVPVPLGGATGTAWATPRPAGSSRRLVLTGGLVADGGWDRRLQERARALGFGDLAGYLQARLDAGWSVPGLARELGVTDWQAKTAVARAEVSLAPRPVRLAA